MFGKEKKILLFFVIQVAYSQQVRQMTQENK